MLYKWLLLFKQLPQQVSLKLLQRNSNDSGTCVHVIH